MDTDDELPDKKIVVLSTKDIDDKASSNTLKASNQNTGGNKPPGLGINPGPVQGAPQPLLLGNKPPGLPQPGLAMTGLGNNPGPQAGFVGKQNMQGINAPFLGPNKAANPAQNAFGNPLMVPGTANKGPEAGVKNPSTDPAQNKNHLPIGMTNPNTSNNGFPGMFPAPNNSIPPNPPSGIPGSSVKGSLGQPPANIPLNNFNPGLVPNNEKPNNSGSSGLPSASQLNPSVMNQPNKSFVNPNNQANLLTGPALGSNQMNPPLAQGAGPNSLANLNTAQNNSAGRQNFLPGIPNQMNNPNLVNPGGNFKSSPNVPNPPHISPAFPAKNLNEANPQTKPPSLNANLNPGKNPLNQVAPQGNPQSLINPPQLIQNQNKPTTPFQPIVQNQPNPALINPGPAISQPTVQNPLNALQFIQNQSKPGGLPQSAVPMNLNIPKKDPPPLDPAQKNNSVSSGISNHPPFIAGSPPQMLPLTSQNLSQPPPVKPIVTNPEPQKPFEHPAAPLNIGKAPGPFPVSKPQEPASSFKPQPEPRQPSPVPLRGNSPGGQSQLIKKESTNSNSQPRRNEKINQVIPKNPLPTNLQKFTADNIQTILKRIIEKLKLNLDVNMILEKKAEFQLKIEEFSKKGSADAKEILNLLFMYPNCQKCNTFKEGSVTELRCCHIACRDCLLGSAEQASMTNCFGCPVCGYRLDKNEEARIWRYLGLNKDYFLKSSLRDELAAKGKLKCGNCKKEKKNFYDCCYHICMECFSGVIRSGEIPCNLCHSTCDYNSIVHSMQNCHNCDNSFYFVGSYMKFVEDETYLFCINCVFDYYNTGFNQRFGIRLKKLERLEINDHLFMVCQQCKSEIFKDNFIERDCGHKVCVRHTGESYCSQCG